MSAAPSSPTFALPTERHTIAESAELYVAAGLAPIPLYGVTGEGFCTCGRRDEEHRRNIGKHPIGEEWQRRASLDVDDVRDRFAKHRGNVGIYLPLGRLVLVDADGETGLTTAAELALPATLTAQSGSGIGAHFIFRLAEHHDATLITDRRTHPGLDVKVRGQFAAAPSRHASGKLYRWTLAIPPAVLPDRIYEQIIKRPPARFVAPAPSSTTALPGDTLRKRAAGALARIPSAVSGSGGHDQTFAAARYIWGWVSKGLSEADGWSLLLEYNARCEPPWSEGELRHKWTSAEKSHTPASIPDRDPPTRTVARRGASAFADGGAGSPPADPPAGDDSATPPGGSPPHGEDWRAELLYTTTRQGKPKLVSHVDNVIRILKLAPEWRGRIRFDEFRSRITVVDPPWDEYSRAARARPYWTDEDATRLQAWMRRTFFAEAFDPSIADIERAVSVVAHTNSFNPVRDYLRSVEWDGTPRLSRWLSLYLGADETPYHRLVGEWWLISAVARIFSPGEKVDTVPILEGPQGLRKSTALKVLAGAEFFNDTPIDLNSKDAYTAIQGCWFVELAELDSLMRVEATRAKAFFSSAKDRFRRAYARHESEELRQCIFVGTTNLDEYLGDPTGARRYHPIRCTRIDVDALARDRDQLWAEAAQALEDGRKWYPDNAEERALLATPQAARTQDDAWETQVAEWLARQCVTQVSSSEILNGALRLDPKDWTRSAQTRVGIVLTARLGWAKRRVSIGDRRAWVYEKPAKNEAGQ